MCNLALAGALMSVGGSATAASVPPPPCKALLDHVVEIMGHGDSAHVPDAAGTRIDASPDSCTFHDLQIDSGHITGWSAERVTLTAPGIGKTAISSVPKVLRVDITGIRFRIHVDDTHARYITAAQQRGFDIHLSYEEDDKAHQFHIREATLESPWVGRVSLDADFDLGAGADAHGGMLDGLALRRVRFVLDNKAIVESLMLPALVGLLPRDKDPAIEIPAIQRKIEQQTRALPSAQVDDASKDALIRFVGDFPHPTGHFEETLNFDRPLSLDALSSDKKAEWLTGAHVAAVYSPVPAPPAP